MIKDEIKLQEFSKKSFFQSRLFENAEKDAVGNYHFTKHGNGEKIQIIFKISPVAVMIGKEVDGKYIPSIFGNEERVMEAFLNKDGKTVGVLRKDKESWYVDKLNTKQNLCGEVLTFDAYCNYDNEKICATDLDEITALTLAQFVLNHEQCADKTIDFTVWNSSLSGKSGLVSAMNHSNADHLLYLSNAKDDDFSKNSGPAFVAKDGSYVMSLESRTRLTGVVGGENPCDFFVGKVDDSLEQLELHALNKNVFGIYIPISHFGKCIEEIRREDLKKTQDLLLKYITTL